MPKTLFPSLPVLISYVCGIFYMQTNKQKSHKKYSFLIRSIISFLTHSYRINFSHTYTLFHSSYNNLTCKQYFLPHTIFPSSHTHSLFHSSHTISFNIYFSIPVTFFLFKCLFPFQSGLHYSCNIRANFGHFILPCQLQFRKLNNVFIH